MSNAYFLQGARSLDALLMLGVFGDFGVLTSRYQNLTTRKSNFFYTRPFVCWTVLLVEESTNIGM